jgi:glycosyltransferase involved in cell wall biosynthesis
MVLKAGFFEHRNEISLREVLARALSAPVDAVHEMGRQARKRIVRGSSWELMMEKYLKLFGKCRVKGFEKYI